MEGWCCFPGGWHSPASPFNSSSGFIKVFVAKVAQLFNAPKTLIAQVALRFYFRKKLVAKVALRFNAQKI